MPSRVLSLDKRDNAGHRPDGLSNSNGPGAQEPGMIVGHGVDVQDVSRIRKLLEFAEDEFIISTFTESERAIECGDRERAEFYAGRLAAKEAIAKAIGTGFAGGVAAM